MTTQAAAVSSHVAIDIREDDDAPGSSRDCAVCMEPAFWVVVGACGHRDVCLPCAVRIRFFQADRRCCICRALCAAVIVTRAPRNDGSSNRQSVYCATSLEPASSALAGVYHWYHGGTGAYFDDRMLYEEVRNICSKPYLGQEDVDDDNAPPQESSTEEAERTWLFLINLAIISLSGALVGLPIAMLLKH